MLHVCDCAAKPPDTDWVWQAAQGGKEDGAEENPQTKQEATCCVAGLDAALLCNKLLVFVTTLWLKWIHSHNPVSWDCFLSSDFLQLKHYSDADIQGGPKNLVTT